MEFRALTARRIGGQMISPQNGGAAGETLLRLGAIQAQDYGMAKWALALRSRGATLASVNAAIDGGEILRTHALRHTWHFVAARDIYWLLDLSGPVEVARRNYRLKQLELDAATLRKAARVMEKSLGGNDFLTREELLDAIRGAGIATDGNRAAHMLGWAELEQILTSGPSLGGGRTHALLQKRVPKARRMTREESLAELAGRYFRSRGPATVRDFSWWSGLTLRDAQRGLESVRKSLDAEPGGAEALWFDGKLRPARGNGVYLLPAFDEFLIAYSDRSAQLRSADQKTLISNNGIFWPIVVSDGAVVGTWRKVTKRAKVSVDVKIFRGAPRPPEARLAAAVARVEKFFDASPAAGSA